MIYMLDTNIISYLIKSHDEMLVRKFEVVSQYDLVVISSISVAELRYSVKKKQSKNLETVVNNFLHPLEQKDFDESSAIIYGDIRVDLEKRGRVIGALDMLIAAHAKSLGATIVTNNTKEFDRVVGLKVENWVA
ncbi:VapC toxin protein [Bathymodiolus thermophilus thioautotrophic gill symbiont]|uniref:VapC toxin protein n=3 Tax=Bathymodiolus thermophilus thioautotrophic gill symbiont TaxID=2360 RepID=A0A8H8XAT2_9GAMM|nr:PIN domain-containing protein [Bathymodiolus thermophilus thioautotrophic gill symbiont]CAB5496458.1 VapC toxin protein [Bathymodiolus thermophilus thioautotrophic gill symbiont]